MRYWPLTAVLLAFWLGRETGAQDTPKIAKFDRIEANSIVVRADKDDRDAKIDEIELARGGILLTKRSILGIHVIRLTGYDFQHRWVVDDGQKGGGSVRLTHKDLTFSAQLPGERELTRVAVGATDREDDQYRNPVMGVKIFDEKGRLRTALGQMTMNDLTKVHKFPRPESSLVLFDEDGTPLVKLPDEK